MSETEFAADDMTDGDEPTMEEILSSIRRIISDDDDVEDQVPEEADEAALEEADDDEEILELTEILAEEDPDQVFDLDALGDLEGDADLLSPDDVDDLEFSRPEPIAEPEPDPEFEAEVDVDVEVPEYPSINVSETLISNQVGQQVNQSFHLLANTLLSQNGAGQTVEAMVMALMRPMLKGWLDDNLPVLVEKIVREEIERVARGGKT